MRIGWRSLSLTRTVSPPVPALQAGAGRDGLQRLGCGGRGAHPAALAHELLGGQAVAQVVQAAVRQVERGDHLYVEQVAVALLLLRVPASELSPPG